MASLDRLSAPEPWPTPTPRICELIRRGAELALEVAIQPELLEEMEQAGMGASGASAWNDPVLMASTRRSTRASLVHWLNANIEHPGQPVPPFVSADMLHNAREMYRLGMPEAIYNSARGAQNVAWQRWMAIAFQLTDDPGELQQLLDVSLRSIATFVEGNMELMQTSLRDEEALGIRDLLVERRELVTQILEGASVNPRDAGRRLGYPLEGPHHGAVIWSEEIDTEIAVLEAAADAFVRACGQSRSLRIIISGAVLWAWAQADQPLDAYAVQSAIRTLPDVRMTFGSAGEGIEGFRRAHVDALTAQRVLGRLRSSARAVSFDRLRLAAIMSRDPEATQRFVTYVLGDLVQAAPSLRQTLLTFLECGSNAAEAARKLHTHRNTLLRRLARAEELLPRPLAHNPIQVAAALEVLHWSA